MTGLSIVIIAGIGKIDFSDLFQVVAVDAVALVVLVDNLVKHVGPGEIAVSRFHAFPGRRTKVLGTGFAVHVTHILESENTGEIVVSGFNITHGA